MDGWLGGMEVGVCIGFLGPGPGPGSVLGFGCFSFSFRSVSGVVCGFWVLGPGSLFLMTHGSPIIFFLLSRPIIGVGSRSGIFVMGMDLGSGLGFWLIGLSEERDGTS
jgi:hypothetical protein